MCVVFESMHDTECFVKLHQPRNKDAGFVENSCIRLGTVRKIFSCEQTLFIIHIYIQIHNVRCPGEVPQGSMKRARDALLDSLPAPSPWKHSLNQGCSVDLFRFLLIFNPTYAGHLTVNLPNRHILRCSIKHRYFIT